MDHNFEAQRRETFDTFRQSKGISLPKTADGKGSASALQASRFVCARPGSGANGACPCPTLVPPLVPLAGLAWSPPLAPDTSTCVVAVASGKGYLPCMSLTKYLRKGMRNRIPRMPPRAEAKNMLKNDEVISGYLACRI